VNRITVLIACAAAVTAVASTGGPVASPTPVTPTGLVAPATPAASAAPTTPSTSTADLDWSKTDQAIGKKGTDLPGGVHKFAFPRSDLPVTVDSVPIKPALALGSWVGFLRTPSGVMIMGDLVLLDTEISPVMQRLIEGGIEITAVHNHLLRTSVPVFYMHIGGHGDPEKLAQSLHAALVMSKTPIVPAPPAQPAALELDVASLETILGLKGAVNGGVYQFSVPRGESISEGGMAIPPAMGTAIAINFQPTDSGKAAISGDFVLLGSEVNPVLQMLRQHGIEVTALHSHMIDDSPHLFFMHFWANDDPRKLARGLRAALDFVDVKRVVFVCEHGSTKSLIATSYFNRRAGQLGLPYRAIARGTAPEPAVPVPVRTGLKAAGFDVSTYTPRLLTTTDVDGASLVVSFDQDVAGVVGDQVQQLKWDHLPSVMTDYTRGSEQIVQRVDALIVRLGNEARNPAK